MTKPGFVSFSMFLQNPLLYEAYINANRRWIKAGVEVFPDKPVCGMVVCDRFADWSLVPLSEGMMTIELVRRSLMGRRPKYSGYRLQIWKKVGGRCVR